MDYGSILAQGLQRKRQNEQAQASENDQAEAEAIKANFKAVVDGVKQSNQELISFFQQYQPEVSVKNFPNLPEMDDSSIVSAVKGLEKALKPIETDNSDILNSLKQLSRQNEVLIEAFKSLDVKPEVSVAAPKVKVDAPDLSPITQAIKEIPQPKPTDLSEVVSKLDGNTQALTELKAILDELPHRMPKTHVDVDPLITYLPSDMDESSSTIQYHGFLANNGSWYIRKVDNSGAFRTIRLCFGSSDYATNWTNRASLAYARWSE